MAGRGVARQGDGIRVVRIARSKVWEAVRLVASLLTGAVIASLSSCLTGGVEGALGGVLQERPNEASELRTEIVRLELLRDELLEVSERLECPADYLARERAMEDLAASMALAERECAAGMERMLLALREAEARAVDAEARAAAAEQSLADIRAALQPDAPGGKEPRPAEPES